MSILSGFLQVFAWSIIIVPVVTLIVGIILSHYLPLRRQVIGILLISFGSLGATVFSFSLYIALIRDRLPVTITFAVLLAIELATIISGVII
jgi:hypothetical protein